ncbi:MAG TPA: histidine kinase dimerization/phosphoacceptor domain -containing protein [Azospirillum sp.]|nr:histidine kinase dimerization/phosphoacceptor domain -containing protein [Azospirillum sp.]
MAVAEGIPYGSPAGNKETAMSTFLPPGSGEAFGTSLDLANMVVENAADSIFVMDLEGRTVFANPAAERTFGWTLAELSGKTLHDMVHHHYPDGRPFPMAECPLGNVFAKRQTLEKHEDLFFRRDGTPIHVACSNAPVLRDGRMIGAVLIAVDISERKRIERRLAEALAARDALIREVHHRVKNSLMMVVGLLHLQGQQVADADARRHFEEARRRVSAVARMHEKLYRIEDVEAVDFSEFLRELCAETLDNSPVAGRVALEVDAEAMALPTDCALPLALVANELVTNAVKHAFPDGRAGRIVVGFRSEDGGWTLRVADDGAGLPDDFGTATTRSLGMRLITALTRQIGASVEVERAAGTAFVLRSAPPSSLISS